MSSDNWMSMMLQLALLLISIRVYQLSDGRRVIHADDIALLFDQFQALG